MEPGGSENLDGTDQAMPDRIDSSNQACPVGFGPVWMVPLPDSSPVKAR